MDALKDQFTKLSERIKEATDHKSLVAAVNEMTEFLNREKNRFAVTAEAELRRAASSSQ